MDRFNQLDLFPWMELVDHQITFVNRHYNLIIPLSIYFIYEDRYISRQTNVSNRKRTKQFVRGHKFSSRRILRPIVTNII